MKRFIPLLVIAALLALPLSSLPAPFRSILPTIVAIIFGGRVAVGHQAVQTAAADAARAASIARTASSARAAARTYAAATLANEGLACVTTNVAVDVSAFSAPVGTPGVVRATVVCDVAVGDLGLPGVRGTMRVEATMASPLDTYRQRR